MEFIAVIIDFLADRKALQVSSYVHTKTLPSRACITAYDSIHGNGLITSYTCRSFQHSSHRALTDSLLRAPLCPQSSIDSWEYIC
jgi:hypothetical protein